MHLIKRGRPGGTSEPATAPVRSTAWRMSASPCRPITTSNSSSTLRLATIGGDGEFKDVRSTSVSQLKPSSPPPDPPRPRSELLPDIDQPLGHSASEVKIDRPAQPRLR